MALNRGRADIYNDRIVFISGITGFDVDKFEAFRVVDYGNRDLPFGFSQKPGQAAQEEVVSRDMFKLVFVFELSHEAAQVA